jgi:hypothetical protein
MRCHLCTLRMCITPSPEGAEEIRQRRLELRDPHIPRSPFRSKVHRRAEEHQEIAESPVNLTTLADAVGDSANEPKSPVQSTRNPQKTPVKQTSSADGRSRKQRPLLALWALYHPRGKRSNENNLSAAS